MNWKWLSLIVAVFASLYGLKTFWHWATTETIYYPSGQIREIRTVSPKFFPVRPANDIEGYFKTFYENGQEESEGALQGNARYGFWRWFYPNGQLKDEWVFGYNATEDGSPKDGTRRSYYENGKLMSEISYLGGKLDERSVTWSPDGKVIDDWSYIKGKPKDGKRLIYQANGMLKQEISYSAGARDGWTREWVDGKLYVEYLYSKGAKIEEVRWDKGGWKRKILTFENGQAKETISFWKNGKMRERSFGSSGSTAIRHLYWNRLGLPVDKLSSNDND